MVDSRRRAGTALAGLLLLGVLAAYSTLLLVPVYTNTNGSDFGVTYDPAARLFVAGSNPYTIPLYVQPPALSLIFAPLTVLPAEPARFAWLLLEGLLLAAGVVATLRVLDFKLTGFRWAVILLVYLSPNISWGWMIGQSVILMFFLQAVGLWLLRAGWPFWAGVALGAVVLKPHLLAVELPVLVSAPRQAWAGAATAIAALLLGPELVGIHLLEPFVVKLVQQVGEERYNKLTPVDMFVNLGGGPPWLHALGWVALGALGLLYLWLLWRVWQTRGQRAEGRGQRAEASEGSTQHAARSTQHSALSTPAVQAAMLAAFLFLPYTLAYDVILVAGIYLWRFRANGYRLDRALTWNLGLLWLLPILTLALHARGIATTLNPLLIVGLLLLVQSRGPSREVAPGDESR